MEHAMELDDFKNAWQTLDRRLQQHNALHFELLRSHRADAMRRGFRPLVIGQAIAMLIGFAAMLWLLPLWTPAAPTHNLAVKVCGIGLHVYCVGLIVFGGIMQGLVSGIDYAQPVLAIQHRLLRMRKVYIIGGMLIGLPWWFLTAPLLVVLTRGAILDNAPLVIWIQLAIGAIGLVATWWLHRWAHRPGREKLGRWLDDSAAGRSIRRAQAALDELQRFERE